MQVGVISGANSSVVEEREIALKSIPIIPSYIGWMGDSIHLRIAYTGVYRHTHPYTGGRRGVYRVWPKEDNVDMS